VSEADALSAASDDVLKTTGQLLNRISDMQSNVEGFMRHVRLS